MKTDGLPSQKLIFVLGKGGVGRSTVAAALAELYSKRNETVLVVQWTVHDAVSPFFGAESSLSHTAREVFPGVSVMCFSPDEAIQEYFVDHLKMRLLYNVVVENKHVKKFIHAAPGVHELFFLGRLYWLVCLAQKERGWKYDRVIVDAPAMGHGVSLFRVAPTIAGLGMTGPLAVECERVSSLLFNEELVGSVVVTIPEELPVEETIEFLPKITSELRRPPLCVVLNRSFMNNLSEQQVEALAHRVSTEEARHAVRLLATDLKKRESFAKMLQDVVDATNTPLLRALDAHVLDTAVTQQRVRAAVAEDLRRSFGEQGQGAQQNKETGELS